MFTESIKSKICDISTHFNGIMESKWFQISARWKLLSVVDRKKWDNTSDKYKCQGTRKAIIPYLNNSFG